MTTTRVDWEGGWADLSDRLTHARRMRIVRALPKADSADPASMMEFGVELAAAHVTAWSEGEVDTVSGPSAEVFDGLPQDAVDGMRDAAIGIWTARADPNGSGPSSPSGPSAKRSRRRTPTS